MGNDRKISVPDILFLENKDADGSYHHLWAAFLNRLARNSIVKSAFLANLDKDLKSIFHHMTEILDPPEHTVMAISKLTTSLDEMAANLPLPTDFPMTGRKLTHNYHPRTKFSSTSANAGTNSRSPSSMQYQEPSNGWRKLCCQLKITWWPYLPRRRTVFTNQASANASRRNAFWTSN